MYVYEKRKSGHVRRPAVENRCETCSEPYLVRRDWAARTKYCSIPCRAKGRRVRQVLVCATCLDPFESTPSKARQSRSGLRFCSRDCKDKAQRAEGMVEIHPEHYGDGSKADYRTKALKDYGAKCARCGYCDNPSMLDAHHRDSDRANNRSDNLEVICVWCHALETRKQKPHAWNGNLTGEP